MRKQYPNSENSALKNPYGKGSDKTNAKRQERNRIKYGILIWESSTSYEEVIKNRKGKPMRNVARKIVRGKIIITLGPVKQRERKVSIMGTYNLSKHGELFKRK